MRVHINFKSLEDSIYLISKISTKMLCIILDTILENYQSYLRVTGVLSNLELLSLIFL